MTPVSPPSAPPSARKSARRLKPEIAAQLAARRREAQLQDLYSRPIEELSPEELAKMRAAFFIG
ncbi:MAG TPA: hypothetical protein VFX98_15925 [Longimicrobiaceae bacterium]|nr:hypothetical protein [Longimicrobiaceae bacterium]